ncbi:MAG: hypothetical protein R2704_11670 [Microthrixaceae bacterium]
MPRANGARSPTREDADGTPGRSRYELLVAVLLPTRELAMQYDPNAGRFYVMSTETGRPGAEIHGSFADAIDAVRSMVGQCEDEAAAAGVFVPPAPGEDEHHDVLAILPRSPVGRTGGQDRPHHVHHPQRSVGPGRRPVHSTFGGAVIELCELVFAV